MRFAMGIIGLALFAASWTADAELITGGDNYTAYYVRNAPYPGRPDLTDWGLFLVLFNDPVNTVLVTGLASPAGNTDILAYNSDGELVADCATSYHCLANYGATDAFAFSVGGDGISVLQDNGGFYNFATIQWARVPEPATLGLLGLGLVALAFARRRQGT